MNKSFGILLISLFMAILACSDPESKETAAIPAEKPLNVFYVRTSPVATSGLNDVIHVTGVIQSDTEAKPSFKTGGVIARTFVKEGDYVKKGQLLAQLDMTEIAAQANQAK